MNDDRRRRSKGPKGRVLEPGDSIACSHTALRARLVEEVSGQLVRVIQVECMNCRAQLRVI